MKTKRLILLTFILCFAFSASQAKGHGGGHCGKHSHHGGSSVTANQSPTTLCNIEPSSRTIAIAEIVILCVKVAISVIR